MDTSLNLNLSDNSIGTHGALYLGEGIAKCATLVSLNLNLLFTAIGGDDNRLLK